MPDLRDTERLIKCAREGRIKGLSRLIRTVRNINAYSRVVDRNALMAATEQNQLEAVDCLLAARANPNDISDSGVTVLCLCLGNSLEHDQIHGVLRSLLKAGADPNTPGYAAGLPAGIGYVRASVPDASPYERPADYSTEPRLIRPLEYTIGRNDHKSMRLLLDAKADANSVKHNIPALASNNHFIAMGYLLDAKVNPNQTAFHGITALTMASKNGHVESAALLLDAGADHTVVTNGAVIDGRDKRVKMLKGANSTLTDGYTALHYAVDVQHVDMVRLLVTKGADPNARTPAGVGPLHIAAGLGDPNVVELLIEAKSDLNSADPGCCPPLSFAADRGCHKVVAQLLRASADPNVKSGHKATSRAFLSAGVDHIAANTDGFTACMMATKSVGILRMLVEAGADLHAQSQPTPDAGPVTALTIAIASHRYRVARWILRRSTADAFQRAKKMLSLEYMADTPDIARALYMADWLYRSCEVCPARGAKTCAKCRSAFYCSRECQSAHWQTHQPCCV
jgi:ankyrin repeat protein